MYLKQQLALAWTEPQPVPPVNLAAGRIAKYLSRTGQTVTRLQLHQKLGIRSTVAAGVSSPYSFRASKSVSKTGLLELARLR